MYIKKIINLLAVVLLPILFICGSLQITTDFTDSRHVGPDEEMRYFMPRFIYDHHRLPTGYETETWGNWSYAFYPQLLGAIISTIFMWAASVFPHDGDTLIRAARFASVLFGVIAAVFVRNTARLVFRKHTYMDAISNLAMLLFALLPQVAFLSSYTNNDIVGLTGVSIITYACVHAYVYGAKFKNALWYAIGASIAMLGYLNSYGFVLVGFIFLLIQLLSRYRSKADKTFVAKYLLIALGVTALITLPFFIRNGILYHGDILGLATFHSEYQRWLDNGGFSMQTPYNGSIYSLFFETHWMVDIINSMIFGYFATWGHNVAKLQYLAYYALAILASGGAIVAYWTSAKTRVKNILIGLLALGSAITLALCLYYTLKIDYQPQGRYIIYLVVPLVLGMTYGINYLLQKFLRARYLTVAIYGISLIYVALYLSVMYRTLLA